MRKARADVSNKGSSVAAEHRRAVGRLEVLNTFKPLKKKSRPAAGASDLRSAHTQSASCTQTLLAVTLLLALAGGIASLFAGS